MFIFNAFVKTNKSVEVEKLSEQIGKKLSGVIKKLPTKLINLWS